jgi:hypothetical protein
MKIEHKNGCPLHNFEPCRQLDCAWFTQVRGHNPNTGAEVDEWACAIAWLPIMLIENSQMQRQTGAAVESFRNEMVRANETNQQILMATQSPQIRFLENPK